MNQVTAGLDFVTLWRALAPGDLPGPVPEYRFHPTRRWRFDFAWPARNVALEVDGGQWTAGGGRHNTDGDREKLNTAAALGWRVLRFSHTALETDPAGCVELAAAALVLGSAADVAPDAGGSDRRADSPAVQLTAPAKVKLQRREGLKLQRQERVKLIRRPGLQLIRREPVKLTGSALVKGDSMREG